MDTGDVVLHRPTGERWLVAYVRDDNLCCLGWPESFARVSDCELIEFAEPTQRQLILENMAAMDGSDSRKMYAIQRLKQAEQILPSEH